MKLSHFVVVAIVLLTQLLNAQPNNTNISNGVSFDGEPYIAINPTNNQNLVAAWMGLALSNGQFRVAIKTKASFNGGATWSNAVNLPHFGSGYGSADVSMAFDRNGLLYICYIDYRQSPDSGGVYVARSYNGGQSWDVPSKAFDVYDLPNKRPLDRPWLVVDNSSTANAGTLYITTKPAPWIAPPNRAYYKVSTDSGRNWTPIRYVDGGSNLIGNAIAAPMAAPAVTKGGKFCAAYPSYVASQNILPAFYLAQSTDKGQTITYSTILTTAPAANDTNYKNGYLLLAHPTDSNKMVFLSPDAMNGDADIMTLRSSNGGSTWSTRVRVNDDAVGNGKGQDMVWGAYNEQGNLVVTWRDRRDAAANGFWNAGYDFYYSTSTDNGQNFSANQKLSSQFIAFDSVIAENGNDFMSCAYYGDTLYTVWGDTRTGRLNIFFAKTIVSQNTTVQVTELENETTEFAVGPNPFNQQLEVMTYGTANESPVMIFDVTGQLVFQGRSYNNKLSINTVAFPVGVYFVRLGNVIRRVVKQ